MSASEQENQQNEHKQSEGGSGIIDLLIEKQALTKDQLKVAISELEKRHDGSRLLDIIVELGFIPEVSISEIISGNRPEQEAEKISSMMIDSTVLKRIPEVFAKTNNVAALQETEFEVKLAIEDIYNIFLLDQVSYYFDNKKITPVKATQIEIQDIIDKYYKYSASTIEIIEELDRTSFDTKGSTAADFEKSPIPRLVDAIISDAIKIGASDIHFEPDEYFTRVRLRVDGILINRISFHKKYWQQVCVRLKILSSMNIAESRKPQDGGINMNIFGRKIDFRVSSIPTVSGENFVLRILDNSKSITTLEALGYTKKNIDLIKLILKKPEGIVIVTGPTGSGKTTTMYSILNMINDVKDNIMTLEEPVEYRMAMIRQSEINHRAGFDFASGLRSLLRQDPDIIFLGEIRDEETARTAIRAAATGHQVFSTLHTNGAIAAITRLLDIGIEGYLLADSLNGIVGQRLTRKLCSACKKKTLMTDEMKVTFGLKTDRDYTIYEPVGCGDCFNTGYKGRVVISEVLEINEEMRYILAEGGKMKEMIAAANKNAFLNMQKDGIFKILNGMTTFEELSDVVDMTKYMKA